MQRCSRHRVAREPGAPRVRAISDSERVIYELHLRGFTRHASSGVGHPGTYLGLIEKIPYLLDLGVTTVELLPLLEFDETENRRLNPETGERLVELLGLQPGLVLRAEGVVRRGSPSGCRSRPSSWR